MLLSLKWQSKLRRRGEKKKTRRHIFQLFIYGIIKRDNSLICNKFRLAELPPPFHLDRCDFCIALRSRVTSHNLNSHINCCLHLNDSALMGLSQNKKTSPCLTRVMNGKAGPLNPSCRWYSAACGDTWHNALIKQAPLLTSAGIVEAEGRL